MHELSVARSIVEVASAAAEGRPVTRVCVEVGAASGVVPHAVRFCFAAVTAGTPLEGAALEIEEVPARGTCRDCGESVVQAAALPRCACGSLAVDVTDGRDLLVATVDVC